MTEYVKTISAKVFKISKTQGYPMFSVAYLEDGGNVIIDSDSAEGNSLEYARDGNYFVTPEIGRSFFADDAELQKRGFVEA